MLKYTYKYILIDLILKNKLKQYIKKKIKKYKLFLKNIFWKYTFLIYFQKYFISIQYINGNV